MPVIGLMRGEYFLIVSSGETQRNPATLPPFFFLLVRMIGSSFFSFIASCVNEQQEHRGCFIKKWLSILRVRVSMVIIFPSSSLFSPKKILLNISRAAMLKPRYLEHWSVAGDSGKNNFTPFLFSTYPSSARFLFKRIVKQFEHPVSFGSKIG